jgi:hypothetical protein
MMQEVADVIQKHIAIMKNEEVVPVIAASASVGAVGTYMYIYMHV